MRINIFFIGLLLNVGVLYSEQVTIRGTLQTSSNPCLTSPCLPGIVFSVISTDSTYFLTKSGFFVSGSNFNYNNVQINIGDSLIITGVKSFKIDKNDNHYTAFEINTLVYNLTDELKSENKTRLFPNPFNESIHVEFDNTTNVDYINIYDSLGNELYHNSTISHLSPFNINTYFFDHGIFHLFIVNKNGTTIVKKMVKN